MGKLIVIEGLDGSGKATQTVKLYERLNQKGIKIKKISFPDYNSPSSTLVKMYLDGSLGTSPNEINPYAASSFYAADRYCSFKQFWKAEYEDNTVILADRYTTSNEIYQLAKLEPQEWDNFLTWVDDYEYKKLAIPKPNIVIYLDMPPEVSQQLMTNRYNGDEGKKDIHESNIAYLKECRMSALYVAKKLGWHIVPCSRGNKPLEVEEIGKIIYNIVAQII